MNAANARVFVNRIHTVLCGVYSSARELLKFSCPYELLIGVILSAQTTDRQVNEVTPQLFSKYPTPKDLAKGKLSDIEKIIHSTGFYRMKAKHIKGAAITLVELYGSDVPGTMEKLLVIPGVGRKSANVVLGHCFDQPAIIVDTHFMRVTNRLGLVDTKDPVKIEMIMKEIVPDSIQFDISMFLNYLGRDFCFARKPDCNSCPLNTLCPVAGSF